MPTSRPLVRALVLATGLIISHSAAARAQSGHASVTLPDVAGVWDYRATVGQPGGTVVASVLTAAATKAGWSIQHDPDAAIPLRVAVIAGDSIVAEAGPYESTLRPGQTVLLNRIVLHYHNGMITGVFLARYSSGDSVGGRVDARRRATPKHPTDGSIVRSNRTTTRTATRSRRSRSPTVTTITQRGGVRTGGRGAEASTNEIETITYLSDGLKVKAYVYRPRDPAPNDIL